MERLQEIAASAATDGEVHRRVESTVSLIARDSNITRVVVGAYKRVCQICREVKASPKGRIAEGAHIRALGSDHQGADHVTNMLCLCPGCHRVFDKGGIIIDDDYQIRRWSEDDGAYFYSGEELYENPGHQLNIENIRYHRTWALNIQQS